MQSSRLIATTMSTGLLAFTGSALAFEAPEWAGGPNSVYLAAQWVSSDEPDWNITTFETDEDSEFPLDSTGPSVIEVAGQNGTDLVITLPNFIDPLPEKLIRLCLSFDGPPDSPTGADPLSLIDVLVQAFDPEGIDSIMEIGRATDPDSGFASYYIDFKIEPNPDFEIITILGNDDANIRPGNLLFIEVYTISIPAPGAGVLALIGGLAATRRRR